MDNLTLEEFERLHGEWVQRNFPNAESWEPLLGACEELGELCHAHLKGRQSIRHTAEEIFKMKKDAVGDTLIYLSHYCRMSGFTLKDCLMLAWDEIKDRDWKKDPMNGVADEQG